MKILFLIDKVDCSGVSNILLNLINGIYNSKFDITIMAASNPQKSRCYKFVKYPFLFHENIKNKILRRIYFLYFNLLPKKYIIKKINANSYDLIIDFKFIFNKVISSIKYQKTLIWIHGDPLTNPYFDSNGFYGKIKNYFKIKAIKKATKIITISKTMKENFINKYGFENKIVIAYNPIDEESILKKQKMNNDLNYNKINPWLCVISRITYDKGIERIIESVKKLNTENYNYNVLIIGDGNLLKKYKQDCDKNFINNIIFLGEKNNPYTILNECDCLISPSHTEAYSTVIVEALVLGKYVICTNVGSNKEIINDNNGLIVDNSTDGVFYGMKYFLDNKNECTNREKYISTYSERIKKIENIFNSLED